MTSGVVGRTTETEVAVGEGLSRARVYWSQLISAAGLWAAGRAALIGFVLLISWLDGLAQAKRQQDWLQWAIDRFMGRDTGHFLRIADVGYPPGTCCDQAFLPGYPLATRLTAVLTGGDLRLASLLVTFVAGAVSAALLWQLTCDRVRQLVDGGEQAGIRAVLYLMVAPYGIFLTVGYSEAMFLAAAMGAWLSATRRHWWIAGVLMALTVSLRINGLFVVAALAVMYLLQRRGGRRWRPRPDLLGFSFPLIMVGVIAAWLHHSTGSWNAWQEAEHQGWGRKLAWPWRGLADGWNEITAMRGQHILLATVAAFATVVLGLLLVVVFGWLRRWPETVYLLLNVLVLVCSSTFVSAPRYGLTWFPAFILAAETTARRRLRWLHPLVLIACLPVLAALAILFSRGAWVA